MYDKGEDKRKADAAVNALYAARCEHNTRSVLLEAFYALKAPKGGKNAALSVLAEEIERFDRTMSEAAIRGASRDIFDKMSGLFGEMETVLWNATA